MEIPNFHLKDSEIYDKLSGIVYMKINFRNSNSRL